MSLGSLTVSDPFRESIAATSSYPENLVERFTYSAALRAYRTRLDRTDKLLVTDEAECEVAFRDFDSLASKFQRDKIRSLVQLRQQLGVAQVAGNAAVSQTGSDLVFQRTDPKCRFVFLYGNHSRASLRTTRAMLENLLSYHQVMASYLDFLFLFGQNSGPNDIRFSGFREQTSLRLPAVPRGLDALGRSGRFYELSYNLKTAQLEDPASTDSWVLRQAGIYHSFDVIRGTTVWIITRALMGDPNDPKHDLKERIEEITGPRGRTEDRNFNTSSDSFRSSLAIHSMTVHWATESWRWYLQWLDEKIETETQHAVHGTRDRKNKGRKWYSGQDLQFVQQLEDKANEISMAVDGNIEVMTALFAYYENLPSSRDWPLRASTEDYIDAFTKQVKNAIYDLKMQSSRAQALAKHTNERKNLVLQYVQAQAAEKMEDLTKSTYSVGISAQKEAIVMRIVTVVALIYLPATFVSTFFSTDVVKYQPGGGDLTGSGGTATSQTQFSAIAMFRWLEVSLPLTAITLLLAWLAYKLKTAQQQRKHENILHDLDLLEKIA